MKTEARCAACAAPPSADAGAAGRDRRAQPVDAAGAAADRAARWFSCPICSGSCPCRCFGGGGFDLIRAARPPPAPSCCRWGWCSWAAAAWASASGRPSFRRRVATPHVPRRQAADAGAAGRDRRAQPVDAAGAAADRAALVQPAQYVLVPARAAAGGGGRLRPDPPRAGRAGPSCCRWGWCSWATAAWASASGRPSFRRTSRSGRRPRRRRAWASRWWARWPSSRSS